MNRWQRVKLSIPKPVLRHSKVVCRRSRLSVLAASTGLIASGLAWVGVAMPSGAIAATTPPTVQPAAGQYFPVTAVKALDTRDGTGGVPVAPLAANSTVIVPVTGIGAIPGDGVTDVYAVITAINPTQPGALEDYNTDSSNPGIWTVPFAAGQQASVSDLVEVSGSGDISVTNASSGTTDVEVTVLGWVQNNYYQAGAGDRYAAVPYAGILDTRSGLGAPEAQVPAGGSLTVQVTGRGGVPAGAAGVAIYLGAANGGRSGWISALPAGATDPALPVTSYTEGATVRDLYIGALSSSGQLTLVNHGSAPVDMTGAVQGYLVGPSGAQAGDTYSDVTPVRIADTRDGTGGVVAAPVPAGASITVQSTGVAGVPSARVPSVVQTVAASSPTSAGFLSVYPAGTADPDNAAVNFSANDGQDNDLTASLVSAVSPTGQETITNHSSGMVNIIVSIRGYYEAPAAPNPPDSVYVNPASQSSATISWLAPYGDGGSPIASYTVTALPDSETVTVPAGTYQATLIGLTNSSADDFMVTAANAVGTSPGADDEYMTVNPDSQIIEQDIGVTFNESTGTETLADSNANLITGSASGQATATPVTPQVSTYYQNDQATAALIPQDTPDNVQIGCTLHVKVSKGAKVNYLGSFDNAFQNGNKWAIAWFNKAWSIDNANIDHGDTKEQWEVTACSSGAGTTFPGSGYKAALSETALVADSSHSYNLDNSNFGQSVTSSSQVTSSESFSLGGQFQGANISVSGGVQLTSNVTNSELNGFAGGGDGHFGLAYPPNLIQYNRTRVNAEWEAHNASGRLTSAVGNTVLATYVWDQTADPDHTFFNVVIFSTCLNGLCGFSYANSTGKGS